MQEMCKKNHLGSIMDKCIAWSTDLYCIQEICPKHQISYTKNVHEMSPIQHIGNLDEISYVLATGNEHEIVLYTVSVNFQEMYKFPVVRNVHTINRKCEQS